MYLKLACNVAVACNTALCVSSVAGSASLCPDCNLFSSVAAQPVNVAYNVGKYLCLWRNNVSSINWLMALVAGVSQWLKAKKM